MRERLMSLSFWQLAGISTTASLMMALGAPPEGLTWLIWPGFIPLALMVRIGGQWRPRRIFALGWFGGLCTGLVGFPWIAETLERFAELPTSVAWFGLLVFSAWTAIPFGLWTWLCSRGPQRGALSIVWPLAAWAGLSTIWPSLFPYTVMIGLVEEPAWIQIAELGGVPLVDAQVVLVGLLGADALLSETRRGAVIRAVAALLIPVAATVLGQMRLSSIDAEQQGAPTVRFGVIQPNTPLKTLETRDRMSRLRTKSRRARAEGAQVLVWPEAGAFPYRTRRPFRHDFRDPNRSVLRGHGVPTIFGAGSYSAKEPFERNTAYAMAADGTVVGTFDKVILVPFGEYVPWVDPVWAIERIPSMSHNIAGDGPARFVIEPRGTRENPTPPTIAAGPLICYEDIFPGFAHEVTQQAGGIDVFVNVTIDTWFGETAEPWEHLALAQFRSVEHRIPMVRSVSAGVSTVVDAGGRIVAHLPVRGPTKTKPVPAEHFVYDVPLARNTERDPTVFARVGWLLPWLCQLAVLVVAFWGALAGLRRTLYSRRNESGPAEPPEPSSDSGPSSRPLPDAGTDAGSDPGSES